MINQYGADIIRLYILFKAPPEAALQWDTKAIQVSDRKSSFFLLQSNIKHDLLIFLI